MFLCFLLTIYLAYAQSGTCGYTPSDCSWEYDSDYKHLTITGNGKMSNYSNNVFINYNPSPWNGYHQSIRTVTIEGVTSIGNSAFDDCTSLQSIVIPDSVTFIGNHAFSYCPSLESVTIPDSVTSIGYSAFYKCISLKSITIPDTVTFIGSSVFSSCTSLQSIKLSNSVTSIGDYAFSHCPSLESIKLSNTVTFIGENAFYNCISLQSIIIPDGVTSIGDEAFYNCTSLQDVTIPNNVTSIGIKAFYDCRNIESFIIKGYIEKIKEYAFCFNETNQVNFEYHSNLPPQDCLNIEYDNLKLLPIFSKSTSLIKVPKNYESYVFCPCDKYGCPLDYVGDKRTELIKQKSVPIEKTLDESNGDKALMNTLIVTLLLITLMI